MEFSFERRSPKPDYRISGITAATFDRSQPLFLRAGGYLTQDTAEVAPGARPILIPIRFANVAPFFRPDSPLFVDPFGNTYRVVEAQDGSLSLELYY